MNALTTILLLIASNIFMTLAWYGHLKLQDMNILTHSTPLIFVILLVGHCLFRVLHAGTCQSFRIYQQRRAFYTHATQDYSGGHYSHRLRPLLGGSIPYAVALEPPVCRSMSHRSSLVRIRIQVKKKILS